MKKIALLAALSVFWIGCQSGSPDEGSPGTAAKTDDAGTGTKVAFNDVQAIFNQRCILCHGENGKEGIDLRSYESVMKGGEHGAIVKPGDAQNSLLVQVLQEGHAKRMPFKQDPLTEDQIKLIEAWVQQGAEKG